MTAPIYANTPSDFDHPYCNASFNVNDGTKAKVIVWPQGSNAAADPVPMRYGGAAVISLVASSNDAANKDFRIFMGNKLTTQDAALTGTINSTASTLVRANTAASDWVREGWRPGMQAMVFAPQGAAENASVDGILLTITGVTQGTLTFNGAPLAVLAALAAGTLIVAVAQRVTLQIPANAGNTNAIPNVAIVGNTLDKSVVTDRYVLGASTMVIAQPLAALSALPATVGFDAAIARY